MSSEQYIQHNSRKCIETEYRPTEVIPAKTQTGKRLKKGKIRMQEQNNNIKRSFICIIGSQHEVELLEQTMT
jgi:succinyl-CoA synthetase beta subunit